MKLIYILFFVSLVLAFWFFIDFVIFQIKGKSLFFDKVDKND